MSFCRCFSDLRLGVEMLAGGGIWGLPPIDASLIVCLRLESQAARRVGPAGQLGTVRLAIGMTARTAKRSPLTHEPGGRIRCDCLDDVHC